MVNANSFFLLCCLILLLIRFNFECRSETKPQLTAPTYDDRYHKNNTTRNPAVARIADRTGCQWPSRSSKVDDFYFVWKGVCQFLLVINSNIDCTLAVFEMWPVFRWQTHIFLTPFSFNPKFENVPLGIDRWSFACPSFTRMANYSYKKFSPDTYPLARVHPLRTDRQTDDNCANSSTVTQVLSANNRCINRCKLIPVRQKSFCFCWYRKFYKSEVIVQDSK